MEKVRITMYILSGFSEGLSELKDDELKKFNNIQNFTDDLGDSLYDFNLYLSYFFSKNKESLENNNEINQLICKNFAKKYINYLLTNSKDWDNPEVMREVMKEMELSCNSSVLIIY